MLKIPYTCPGCNVHSIRCQSQPTQFDVLHCKLCTDMNHPQNDPRCLKCRSHAKASPSRFCGEPCRFAWAKERLPPASYYVDLPNFPSTGGQSLVHVTHVSDTHANLDAEHVRDAIGRDRVNVLVHSGDYTYRGDGLDTFLDQMRSFDKFHYKVIISGNHDSPPLVDPEFEWKVQAAGVIHLVDEEIEIQGVRFYGIPWTNSNVAFCLKDENQLNAKFDAIPAGTDVLIAHNPPINIMDLAVEAVKTEQHINCHVCGYGHSNKWQHRGSARLAQNIDTMKIPVVLFGHVHDTTGQHKTPHTLYSNAATAGGTTQLFDIAQTAHRPPVCTIDLHSHPARLQGYPCCSPSEVPHLLRLPMEDKTSGWHTFPIKGRTQVLSPQGEGLSSDFTAGDLLSTKMHNRQTAPTWTYFRLVRNLYRHMHQGDPQATEQIVQECKERSPACIESLQNLVDEVLLNEPTAILFYLGVTPPGQPLAENAWRFLDEDLFSEKAYVCLYPYRARANQVWKYDTRQQSIQSLATKKFLGRNTEGKPAMFAQYAAATCQWNIPNLVRPALVM